MSFAEGPPDLPYPKLPFWRTVGLSYSTYFRYFIDALRTSWLWLILAAVFSAYANWQQWSWMATTLAKLKPDLLPQVSKPLELTVLFALDNILLLLAGVSIAVAWHRLIILDERPGFSGSNVVTGNLWRYIGVTIAIFLIGWLPAAVVMVPALFYLPEAPGSPPPAGFFPVILLVLLLYAVGVAVTLRLSLLLPARAVGDAGLTIKQRVRAKGATQRSRLYCHFAPAFCAYSQEAFDSGTVRFADSMALALAAVPSRMRPAMPWVMPASRNKL